MFTDLDLWRNSVREYSEELMIIQRFLNDEPLGATSAACLALAWRHRESLMQGA
jgi:hypothetical protein